MFSLRSPETARPECLIWRLPKRKQRRSAPSSAGKVLTLPCCLQDSCLSVPFLAPVSRALLTGRALATCGVRTLQKARRVRFLCIFARFDPVSSLPHMFRVDCSPHYACRGRMHSVSLEEYRQQGESTGRAECKPVWSNCPMSSRFALDDRSEKETTRMKNPCVFGSHHGSPFFLLSRLLPVRRLHFVLFSFPSTSAAPL